MDLHELEYDKSKWKFKEPVISNTVQMFITNRCNLHCRNCFYAERLGFGDITLTQYIEALKPYLETANKVVLVGGEPTFHQHVLDMVRYNRDHKLKTTIYTNGSRMEQFFRFDMTNLTIRLGVDGFQNSDKPIKKIKPMSVPITINYMLDPHNIEDLYKVADYAEEYNCNTFFISRYRDSHKIEDYWRGTATTLSSDRYFEVCQEFIDRYNGSMKEIHFLRGGTMKGGLNRATSCRFTNVFPDGSMVICPIDICQGKLDKSYAFGTRPCKKFSECLLQKLILERV